MQNCEMVILLKLYIELSCWTLLGGDYNNLVPLLLLSFRLVRPIKSVSFVLACCFFMRMIEVGVVDGIQN